MRAPLSSLLAVMLALSLGLAHGQVGGFGSGAPGVSGGPGQTPGQPLPPGSVVSEVAIVVSGLEDSSARGALEAIVAEQVAIAPGSTWDEAFAQAQLARVRALNGVIDARWSASPLAGGSMYRLELQIDAAPAGSAEAISGTLTFPTLYKSGSAYLKAEVSGGHGVFSDGEPWFGRPEIFTAGNPLVENPPLGAETGDRATWAESSVQLGLAGIASLNAQGLYGFGAITGIGVISYGQDIFRDDTRSSANLEKAYVGLLYAPQDSDLRLKLSVGRQNYSLNNGFLVSQYGSQWNAGPRPGVYLAPRTTQDMSIVASAESGLWKGTFFALDPNELESLESDTRLLGLNIARGSLGRWSWDLTALHVPRSETSYRAPDGVTRSREGLWTTAGHVRMRTRPDRSDFWFESELAHQRHDEFDMSAWAGYAELGFLHRKARWSPSLSYRWAAFTGDDPDTTRYERFDTLYGGGLDHWLQGITINKVLTQANRRSHRIRFNINPLRPLNLTMDLYSHRADELNNLGANPAISTLSSRDLGEEIQLTARWQVNPRVMVLGIASKTFPGEALDSAAGGDAESWNTLQVQLFWGF